MLQNNFLENLNGQKFNDGTFPTESVNIILGRWRPETARKYRTHNNQWLVCCNNKKIDLLKLTFTL